VSTPSEIAAARIRDAHRTTVLTGAGVSAASGVPTFRGAGGLWRNYRAEDLATAAAFAHDPAMVWEWYDWRRSQVAACRPNRAHEVLADWSATLPGFSLVTQNVDGLHERAGTGHVTRLHGSLWTLRCWNGCGAAPWANTDVPLAPLPPRCPSCGGLARPGVVWFNEHLDPADVARADRACVCDVFLVVGTAAIVYPAAGLAGTARRCGAFVIEINPEPTGITSDVDLVLRGPAEVVLDAIDRQLPRT
jgi:NAD-dependent deacetylase